MVDRLKNRKNIFAQIFEPTIEKYDEERSYNQGKKRKGEEQEEEFQRKEDFEARHMESVKGRLDSLKDIPGFDEMDLPKQLGIITAVVGKDVAEEYGKGAQIDSTARGQRKDPLTLNESLNQTNKLYDKNQESILVKHGEGVVKDLQGNVLFDFSKMQDNKDKVINDFKKNEKKRRRDLLSTYQRRGEVPPEGLLEESTKNAKVKLENGTKISYNKYVKATELLEKNKKKWEKDYQGKVFSIAGVKIAHFPPKEGEKEGTFEIIGPADEQPRQ